MIAKVPRRRSRKSAKQRMDDQFVRMLPAICRQASLAFGRLDDEQREERIAEVVANAYCVLVRLAKRGRLHLAFPTPLASFAIRQVRAGRRVGCNLNVRDITSRHCQRAKGSVWSDWIATTTMTRPGGRLSSRTAAPARTMSSWCGWILPPG